MTKLSVTAQDLQAVIRIKDTQITDLQMMNASLTRQFVELQAEHAKCGKPAAADTPVASDGRFTSLQ